MFPSELAACILAQNSFPNMTISENTYSLHYKKAILEIQYLTMIQHLPMISISAITPEKSTHDARPQEQRFPADFAKTITATGPQRRSKNGRNSHRRWMKSQ
ncbi:hypothetical protein [Pseudochelatococcus contaminans]|uniref:Uncharacterized protein n=1 Tax=Pseudochelatococcus contaminans TaxID=1538103 RepID=A0A7W5Z5T4_9HYPH|nr:hypothetical protein [Pseudochelatococcus contaminans]MBB3810657.1 hypothetical protein [Pseudochelatococcus contaminans]